MAKKLRELDEELIEALNVWQFYRQLGFTADQIFAGLDSGIIYVVVKWRGFDFSIAASKWEGTEGEFVQAWSAAADIFNAASHEELDEIWQASSILARSPGALIAMTEKGIFWPDHENFRNLN